MGTRGFAGPGRGEVAGQRPVGHVPQLHRGRGQVHGTVGHQAQQFARSEQPDAAPEHGEVDLAGAAAVVQEPGTRLGLQQLAGLQP